MNTLPLSIPLVTPTTSSSDIFGHSPTPSPSFAPSEDGKLPTESGATPSDITEGREDSVLTYRAKSSTIAISPHPFRRSHDHPRSYSITGSQNSVRSAMLADQESSCSEAATPIYSPSCSKRNLKDQVGGGSGESGYNTASSGLEGKIIHGSPCCSVCGV